jgi:glucose-1-phosphatase
MTPGARRTSGLRAIICDLGGVVIRIDPDRIRQAWSARSQLPREQVHAAFPDEVYDAFERGHLSEQDYLEHVRRQLKLDGSDAQLTDDFNQLYLGIDAELVRLLRGLREAGLHLIALTNTNALHEPVWSRRFASELAVFHDIHCSHELGARKPEPAAFMTVLTRHGLAPDEALFIDDLPGNVEAARNLGIHGVVFENTGQIAAYVDALRPGHQPADDSA